jgi:hypothetical protein
LPELQKTGGDSFPILHKHLLESLAALRDAGTCVLATAKTDPALAAATAAPFLRLAGNVIGGAALFKTALLATNEIRGGSGDPVYARAKILTAEFYAEHILTLSTGLAKTVKIGGKTVISAAAQEYF